MIEVLPVSLLNKPIEQRILLLFSLIFRIHSHFSYITIKLQEIFLRKREQRYEVLIWINNESSIVSCVEFFEGSWELYWMPWTISWECETVLSNPTKASMRTVCSRYRFDTCTSKRPRVKSRGSVGDPLETITGSSRVHSEPRQTDRPVKRIDCFLFSTRSWSSKDSNKRRYLIAVEIVIVLYSLVSSEVIVSPRGIIKLISLT